MKTSWTSFDFLLGHKIDGCLLSILRQTYEMLKNFKNPEECTTRMYAVSIKNRVISCNMFLDGISNKAFSRMYEIFTEKAELKTDLSNTVYSASPIPEIFEIAWLETYSQWYIYTLALALWWLFLKILSVTYCFDKGRQPLDKVKKDNLWAPFLIASALWPARKICGHERCSCRKLQ